jgi:MFS transporter, DHA1 family, multidrug resistance protein
MKQGFWRMVLLAACTSLGPLSLNLYLPSITAVQQHFTASLAQVQTTVSLALFAFGVGLVLLGPLTDRVGRRPCLLLGLLLFVCGSVLAAFAVVLEVLAAARVLQSVGCALAFISARSIVADVSPREELSRSVAQMTMIMLVVQMVSPLLGNLIMVAGGWRAIQFASAALAMGLLLSAAIWQPETVSVAARAAARNSWRNLVAPTLMVLVRPGFIVLLVQVGLLYSAYPAFVSIAPHLMVEAFGRPQTEFAYYFALLPVGYFAGNAFVLKFGSRYGEHRLVALGALLATLACVVSMALLLSGLHHPLSLFIPAGALLNFGLGLALPTVSARAVSQSAPHVGSGWGLVGCAQQVLAAMAVQVLSLFTVSSPYPVLLISMLSMGVVYALELRREKLVTLMQPLPKLPS